MSKEKVRYEFIDFTRGFSVLLMIIFHFSYDLDFFHIIDIDIINHPFWWTFPRVIVFIFFLAVGMSLALVHSHHIRWASYNKRLIKLLLFSIIISGATYIAFPTAWVYFGTLHSIALCSILALPLLSKPKLCLFITLTLCIPSMLGHEFPFIKLDHYSMDYISIFPWFGIVTLGIFAYHQNLHKIPIYNCFPNEQLLWLGKNAFIIYLVHQPLLFSISYLISLVA